ncbi:virion structural protein [Tenacibaculum phage Gundel_1]|uniref:Structural protein n=1 Tax=Tenacibaculum phage Gundel_1 TaxID=2745672 RepID=A0A8E4ZDZ0_9CAUD|nr:virion structural protein [Tenacibaculum phage Gundel_1]QQV91492.1 structural protein [Tenacibaculum phage Gundel_1]
MIDRLFQFIQDSLNKEQMEFLKPRYFNSYLNTSLISIYNKLLSDVKSNTRKSNWMLDGKNLADFSKHTQQLLEHFLSTKQLPLLNGSFALDKDIQLIQDVYTTSGNKVDKIDLNDFNLIKRNNYIVPSECEAKCTKLGDKLLVLPTTITTLDVYYLRLPKIARWTYEEVNGKPMFDPGKSDFQDVDIPEMLFDELANLILEKAGLTIRDTTVIQSANQDQQQDLQIENNR